MPVNNKVVVRCRDKRIFKGYTFDFTPNKDVFHVVDHVDRSVVSEVQTPEVKAIFYVKSFEGQPGRPHANDFTKESLQDLAGLKLKVVFEDGEVMYGTTNGYTPQRKGFFVFPADKTSNNERVYVFTGATTDVESWR